MEYFSDIEAHKEELGFPNADAWSALRKAHENDTDKANDTAHLTNSVRQVPLLELVAHSWI